MRETISVITLTNNSMQPPALRAAADAERYTAKGVLLDSKTELLSIFEKFKQALFDCDSSALRQMIAEDYQGFDPQGQPQGRNMILEAYRPGGVKLDAYDVEELEARIIEPVGMITGRGRIHGKYTECDFEHLVRFVDLYIQRGGRWQLFYSQVTPLKAV